MAASQLRRPPLVGFGTARAALLTPWTAPLAPWAIPPMPPRGCLRRPHETLRHMVFIAMQRRFSLAAHGLFEKQTHWPSHARPEATSYAVAGRARRDLRKRSRGLLDHHGMVFEVFVVDVTMRRDFQKETRNKHCSNRRLYGRLTIGGKIPAESCSARHGALKPVSRPFLKLLFDAIMMKHISCLRALTCSSMECILQRCVTA